MRESFDRQPGELDHEPEAIVSSAAELQLLALAVFNARFAIFKPGTSEMVLDKARPRLDLTKPADFFPPAPTHLPQRARGYSRHDVEASSFARYFAHRICDVAPVESLDPPGVGAIVEMGTPKGRKTRPDIKLGVCGEHGGDPSSIHFFENVGLDYVSCSPYRVPVARLAAAQAALAVKVGD